jgi:hypothetical protein
LAVAIKALAEAKIESFERYMIRITRNESESRWGVWFIALPETPGMDVYVTVADDEKTSILLGR